MISRTLTLLALLGSALLGPAPALAAVETSEDLQRVCEEFYSLQLDPARAYDVKDAVITRDVATLRLGKGVLIYSKPIEGVTPVAVFIGKGSLTVTPVRKMDREMLSLTMRDHLNKDVDGMINTKISQALLADFGETWTALSPALKGPRPATESEMKDAGRILSERLSIMDTSGPALEFSLIGRILEDPQGDGNLHVEVDTDDFGWLQMSWTPAATYELRLSSRTPLGRYYMVHGLVRAHKKEDLDVSGHYVADPIEDQGNAIKVQNYGLNIEIPDLQQILIDGDVTFEALSDDLKVIWFSLVNDIYGPEWDSRAKWIDVESLTDSEGHELPRLHRKGRLFILPGSPPGMGERTTYSFRLRENTLIQLSNVHWLMLNTYPWFPQYGYLGGQYSFNWNVRTVKPLTATGSGKTIRTWEEASMNGVEMTFDRPVQFPSLIFGRYQAETDSFQSKISGQSIDLAIHSWPVTVYKLTDPQTCRLLNLNCPVDIEITVPRGKNGDLLEMSKTIIEFLEDLYGPFPYDKLDVAMMAPGLGFGQAPPGFIQLTGEAFMSSSAIADAKYSNPDFIHEFYSHEMAHQWWGHKIGWISDEDQWLSESFAEYSAALYVLNLLGNDRYQAKIRRWEENAKNGDPHGSIAWSNNLSGVNGGRWYQDLIYNKGPYVVHMLRMLMGLDNFKQAMQNLFRDHGYENVTTIALKEECEKLTGYSLDFFFDQWFYGTGIPVFDYSWTATETGEGKYMVEIKISQRDKENFKKVLMPVYFYFKGTEEPLIRARPITEPDHVYKLLLPQKPDRIVLDQDNDILGDVIPASGSGM